MRIGDHQYGLQKFKLTYGRGLGVVNWVKLGHIAGIQDADGQTHHSNKT